MFFVKETTYVYVLVRYRVGLQCDCYIYPISDCVVYYPYVRYPEKHP